jgi:uncharacterized protein YjiS (DUF1127 family)
LENLVMIPGSLNVPRDVPRAVQPGAVSQLAKGITVLCVAAHGGLRILSEWRKRAASRRELANLDDRLLHDIGLTRTDAERELMKPFWRP